MAIQPFAMQAQTAQFNLPSEALAGGERLKGLQNRNAMMAGEMQDKQNLDQAYRQSGGDINAMLKNPNLGFEAGTKLQSLSSENVKAQAAAQAANIDRQLKMLDAGAQVVGGANDQASWDAARNQMGQMFGEEAMNRLPAQYDPNAQRTLMEQSMSFKDKLDLQRSQLQMQREERMAGQQDRMYQLALNRDGRAAAGGGSDQKAPKIVTINGQSFEQLPDGTYRQPMVGGAPVPTKQQLKPANMPPAALKMQQEALDSIGTVGTINADLGAIGGMIDQGRLNFGPVSNLKNKALNAAGVSNEQSRNFATFQSTLEKLRNDSLRLNKGVQTDGDAQRAWNELFQNVNDKDVVKQRLQEIQKINERGAALQQMNVDTIRSNYGAEPLDASGRLQQAPALGNQQAPDDHSSLWN